MFDGLNALPWYDLKHAYGSGEEVPMWLRQLTSNDAVIRKSALNHLHGSICHQGWTCPATAYAVPYLLELLQVPAIQVKGEILELLEDIASADQDLSKRIEFYVNATILQDALSQPDPQQLENAARKLTFYRL